MYKVILLSLSILAASCSENRSRSKEGKSFIVGTIQSDVTTDTVYFRDCYCNLVGSVLKLNYIHLGYHGGSLELSKSNDQLDAYFSYYPYSDKVKFIEKEVVIESGSLVLGEQISGTVRLLGSGDDDGMPFELECKGNFYCILHDSTYNYKVWYQELLDRFDSIEMTKLSAIADRYPDSIKQLQLDFRRKHFPIIRTKIHSFKNVEKLYLSNFSTSELTILGEFKSVSELTLHSDSLIELPKNIADYTNLKTLRITGPLLTLPEGLYSLQNLEVLDLGATNITEISNRIKNLKNLTELNIGHTPLTKIPLEIFQLKNLNTLSLPDTLMPFKITKLDLESIKTLHISYEFLLFNKDELYKLRNLEWLYPSFVYKSHEDYMKEHYQKEQWLQKQLPNVRISSTTYVNE